VESIEPGTAKKLFDFVLSGGRIFYIEAYPNKAPGWRDHERRDIEVQDWINKMKSYPDRFIFLKKPDKNFTDWYKTIQEKYNITPYVSINSPNAFITQVRYQANDKEMLFLINSNVNTSYEITVTLSHDIISGKQAWLWDAESGERYRLTPNTNTIILDMGPADLKLLVFDKEKKGGLYKPVNKAGKDALELINSW
jgi:hypothetical protein